MFTPKQLEVIKYNNQHNPKILISEGAIRSGKSYQNDFIWMSHVAEHQGKNYKGIIIGRTIGTVKRNVIDEMEKKFNFKASFNDKNEFEFLGNTMCCFGANDKRAYSVIKGMTSELGAYINEASLCDERAVREVLGRSSGKTAKIIMDTNPDHANHWIKQELIDKTGQKLKSGRENIKSFHFDIMDNAESQGGFVSDEYIETLKLITPKGVFYNRDILGLWVASDGVIYDMIDDHHIIDYDPREQCTEYYITCDYGMSNATVFLLIGKARDKYFIIDEYVFDGKNQAAKTDDVLVQDLMRLRDRNERSIKGVIVDPSAKSFINQLRRDGKNIGTIRQANNSVIEGIRNVQYRFHNNKLYIHKRCKLVIKELGLYVWDEKSKDDKPIKDNDHSLDALRYYFQTLYPIRFTTANRR